MTLFYKGRATQLTSWTRWEDRPFDSECTHMQSEHQTDNPNHCRYKTPETSIAMGFFDLMSRSPLEGMPIHPGGDIESYLP